MNAATKIDGGPAAPAEPTVLRAYAQAGADGYTHFGSGVSGSVVIPRLIYDGPSADVAYALANPSEYKLRLDCVADGGIENGKPDAFSFIVVSGPWPPAGKVTNTPPIAPLPAPGPTPTPPIAPIVPIAGAAPLAPDVRQANVAELLAEDYGRAVGLAEREAANGRILDARRINAAELHAEAHKALAAASTRDVELIASGVARKHVHEHQHVHAETTQTVAARIWAAVLGEDAPTTATITKRIADARLAVTEFLKDWPSGPAPGA